MVRKVTKNETVQELIRQGYEALNIDGVVLIKVTDKEYKNPKHIKNLLKEIGYNASWGVYTSANDID